MVIGAWPSAIIKLIVIVIIRVIIIIVDAIVAINVAGPPACPHPGERRPPPVGRQ